MVALRENAAGAGRGGLGLLPRPGRWLCRRAGWDSGGGLPVTPALLGMRTRIVAWRWGCDLRVAHCCLEHAGQYSGPGAADRDPRAARRYPTGQAQEVAAVSRPQVIDDEQHERVHERVAAIDVAKDSGMVCTRTPHPSRPGARRSTVWTVRARMGAVRALGRQLARDGIEIVTLESTSGLLEGTVLPAGGVRAGGAAGQRCPGQEPARAPQNDKLDAQWLARLTE